MNRPPAIPRRTQAELACPASPGGRHEQARRIIFSLVAQGFCGDAVFAQVRGMYGADFKDGEIWSLIRGAAKKNPQPSGYGIRYHNSPAPRPAQPVTAESAAGSVERFLKSFRCDEADVWHVSPWPPLEDPAFDALPLMAGVFHGGDLVNVCPEHGAGITKTRDEWMAHLRNYGAPSGSIGCMFRPNPVSGTPTGDKGGWTDADITVHRFALVESDILPLDLQLSVLARLPLPIAAIIFSGGKSYHALVRVDAPDAVEYRKDVSRMLALLRPLGFDQSTGNPSRMARLPGATRGTEHQRLVYLNPDASGETSIFGGQKINLDELETELVESGTEPREPRIKVFTPSELRAYNPAQEPVLVGDNHVTRGEVFVIGGEPGVGKSRLAVSLAIAGATGSNWLGLKVRHQFRTLILQTENGRYRLKNDFDEIARDGLDDWLRISEPPPFGLTFNNPEFQDDLATIIADFKPHVALLDPWNAVAKDDRQRDYAETFDIIRAILPKGDDKPALGIVAHTRKPQTGERRNGGTGLMHTLSGSYVLTSVPRCIWIVVRGSEDETDQSVVVFNPKNSNGQNSPRSAWVRKNGLFEPLAGFDWKQFDKPPDERRIIRPEDIKEVLEGKGTITKATAAESLMAITEMGKSACYDAFKAGGKFGHLFTVSTQGITWR